MKIYATTAAFMTRRGALQALLAGGASLFLAGCATTTPAAISSPGSATTATGSATNSSAQPTSTTAAPSGQKVTVAWWMASQGDDLKAFEIAPNAYMQQHPQVTVEVTGIQNDLVKVTTAIAAGAPPDMVQGGSRPVAFGLYYQGSVQPLDAYIKQASDLDISQIQPTSLKALQDYNGIQWALPDMVYCSSDFFYNTKLFTQQGVDPSKPPQTLQELETLAAKFNVTQGNQLTQVGFHPGSFVGPNQFAFASAGKFYDAQTGKVTPDDPGVVAGLQWWLNYWNKYGVDNLKRLQAGYGQYQSAQNPFLAGKVAMTCFWDAMVAYHARYAPSIEYDMAWFPYNENTPAAKGWGQLSFNATWIPMGSKEKDAAWDVLKFIETDIDSTLAVAIGLANTPHLLSAINAPGASKADPILRKCWDYVAKAKMSYFPPSILAAQQYADEWNSATQDMLAGKVSIQDGVQRVASRVQPVEDKAHQK